MLVRFYFYCYMKNILIYVVNWWPLLTADNGDNQIFQRLCYEILRQNGRKSKQMLRYGFPREPKDAFDGHLMPRWSAFSPRPRFSIFISGKGGRDDTQQALAFSEMIKMFINTDPSRWWNLSHTPAAPTWKRLWDMTTQVNKSGGDHLAPPVTNNMRYITSLVPGKINSVCWINCQIHAQTDHPSAD